MKLLLFSDIHGSRASCDRLVARSPNFDVVVGAGDFCNMHRGLDRVIESLSQIRCPTILVPGNSETTEELRAACVGWEAAIVLHGEGTQIDGVPFFGIGGGIPVTPFGSWSYDFTEDQAADLLADCAHGGVLVSHSPPHGLLDVSSRGQHLGSTAVLSAMERCLPKLVVCGHIHASAGQQTSGFDCDVVNAGPAGMEYELLSSNN